jgi:hypothetical protein
MVVVTMKAALGDGLLLNAPRRRAKMKAQAVFSPGRMLAAGSQAWADAQPSAGHGLGRQKVAFAFR